MSDNPLVTCMMMTGSCKKRRGFAARALLAFIRQTYSPRQLIVVNQSKGLEHEYRVRDNACPKVKGIHSINEILTTRPSTLGEMRNLGLEAAKGGWLMQWDDDDWQHENRIKSLMWMRRPGWAVVPTSHVCFSFQTRTAYTYRNPGGSGGMMLFPKTSSRYELLEKGEDSQFFLTHFSERSVIWDNRGFGHAYLRFFHGNNVSSAVHVMQKYQEEKWHGRWIDDPTYIGFMTRDEALYLKKVLKTYYGFRFPRGLPWNDLSAVVKKD